MEKSDTEHWSRKSPPVVAVSHFSPWVHGFSRFVQDSRFFNPIHLKPYQQKMFRRNRMFKHVVNLMPSTIPPFDAGFQPSPGPVGPKGGIGSPFCCPVSVFSSATSNTGGSKSCQMPLGARNTPQLTCLRQELQEIGKGVIHIRNMMCIDPVVALGRLITVMIDI